MKRNKFPKRENYELLNEQIGFDFQVLDHKKYWLEDVGYAFTSKEIDEVEKAANELHQMCFAAIDNVISNDRFAELNIPEKMIPYIIKSWQREDWSLYGRFDFCFDGKKLKMLEYNADTPTSLVEASLAQWNWKEGQDLPDQFNSIDEKMVAWWQSYKEEFKPSKVYFTTVKENQEDFRNTEYIMDTASRAGIEVDFIFIEDIGSDGEYLYNLDTQPIEFLFKLYPWEWLSRESFIDAILNDKCKMIEPPWKMILSNKGLLAILWELFPNHEYLLPTYFSPEKLGSTFVKKPFLSREGQNVEIINGEDVESQTGLYKSEFNIYQQLCLLPKFDDVYAVVGAWVVGEEACGLGIREDQSKITANGSCFAPHYFEPSFEDPKPPIKTSEFKAIYEEESLLATSSSLMTLGKIFLSLGLVTAFVLYWVSCESDTEKVNRQVRSYNETQESIKNDQVFSKYKRDEALLWIKANVEVQEPFIKFAQLHHDLVEKGISSREDFIEIDDKLSMIVFCIQGENDIKVFDYFVNNVVMESENQEKVINYLKNKYNYSSRKIRVPDEEEILQFCQFKSFEKDLKEVNSELNAKQTSPTNRVIEESL